MARIADLSDAVADLIHDGDVVAMEGFTHLIPHAAGHEVIRQRRKDLTLVRMTPDIIYDQLVGVGAARALVFSWAGNPGVGSLHRVRDAIEHGWPAPLAITEFTHAEMAAAYVAGASGLPFGVLRATPGTDLSKYNDKLTEISDPFTGARLRAVAAHRPDVTVIHAQRADRAGNVQLWGIVGIQKEAAFAAHRVLATVEEIVDELPPQRGAVVIPAQIITAVCEVPGGSYPSYAHGFDDRDNAFYTAWDSISRDRARFGAWIERHVLGTANMAEHRRSLASGS